MLLAYYYASNALLGGGLVTNIVTMLVTRLCGWCRVVPGGAEWCRVVPGGAVFAVFAVFAGWCRVVPGGAGWCRVVPGGAGCRVVPGGAGWCRVVPGGAGWCRGLTLLHVLHKAWLQEHSPEHTALISRVRVTVQCARLVLTDPSDSVYVRMIRVCVL